MLIVAVKTDEQFDLQALHRVRERWIQCRVALVKQIRGFLVERGIPMRVGAEHLRTNLPAVLENAKNCLTGRARTLLLALREEWGELEKKIFAMTEQIGHLVDASLWDFVVSYFWHDGDLTPE